ncbi:MAG: ThuA domain-containing protein [Erythrobacter sp.]|nr:ThuA domain-containing protein [Erythrobacter sp.]
MKLVSRKGCGVLLLVLLAIPLGFVAANWDVIQRVFLGGVKVYETEAPAIPADLPHPAVLVFSKTNAFRHEEAIPAANALFADFARDNGWGYFQTENGATFSPEILSRFDAVVFNNVSGDVFTPEQRAAFQAFLENGGGYVGIHAAGDNSHAGWPWYVSDIIGTSFIGHPMSPQFQQAQVTIEDHANPATATLGDTWLHTDEWYSFDASPRPIPGLHVLATIDEQSYSPDGMFGQDLRMGADHPVVWWRCVVQGRALYSAIGHTAESYAEPEYRALLLGATRWAMGLEGEGCGTPAPVTGEQE